MVGWAVKKGANALASDEATYGEMGRTFAEGNHKVPVAQLKEESRTKREYLAIVCANCHRMFHRSASVLTVEDLRAVISAHRS